MMLKNTKELPPPALGQLSSVSCHSLYVFPTFMSDEMLTADVFIVAQRYIV